MKTILILGSEFPMEQSNNVNDSIEDDTENLADSQEEEECTNKLKCGCSQVEGKSETSTEGIYWHDNYTIK